MKTVRFGTLGALSRFGIVGTACAVAALCAAALSSGVRAQVILPTEQVYVAKFVCGFKAGFTPPQENVVNGPGIYDYRDFEPGSYATAINVFFPGGAFLSASVDMSVSLPETPVSSALRGIDLGPVSILSSGTVKVDCESIIAAINSQAPNALPQIANLEVIEGFVYIPRPEDDLIVEAVYSYSSQIGTLGGEPINPVGTGVGASVHVQNIEPKSIPVLRLLR